VKNREGVTVKPTLDTVTAAANASLGHMADDQRYSCTDPPGKDSYPICGTTWAVVFVQQPANKANHIVHFLRWATHEGQAFAAPLHYARLPDGLVERLDAKLAQITGGNR